MVGVSSNIAVKELISVVMAAAMWGKQWRGQVVNCRCDSMAVVAVIKSRASKESEIMHLLQCVAFIEARWKFMLVATHLAGVEDRASQYSIRSLNGTQFDKTQLFKYSRLEPKIIIKLELMKMTKHSKK